jgi:hypothetical protein
MERNGSIENIETVVPVVQATDRRIIEILWLTSYSAGLNYKINVIISGSGRSSVGVKRAADRNAGATNLVQYVEFLTESAELPGYVNFNWFLSVTDEATGVPKLNQRNKYCHTRNSKSLYEIYLTVQDTP